MAGRAVDPWLDRQVTGLPAWRSELLSVRTTSTEGSGASRIPPWMCYRPAATNARTVGRAAVHRRPVGIGSADAHGTRFTVGPLTHTVFPYDFLFSCVNTHLLTKSPLTGDAVATGACCTRRWPGGAPSSATTSPAPRAASGSAQGQGASAVMGEPSQAGRDATGRPGARGSASSQQSGRGRGTQR